jgi:RHS repeat-associated protein
VPKKKGKKGGRNNVWNTPYLFNAKELDEETGLYYYGARYYDARSSVWLSVDPIATYNPFEKENFIDGQHNGGVYNSFNLAVYGYCYQNPVKLVDPNGKQTKPGQVYSLEEYITYWEKHFNGGKTMTVKQRMTLYSGCIGVTALNLGITGQVTSKNHPPLYPAYLSLDKAKEAAKKMEENIRNNPEMYANGEHVVLYAKRFYARRESDWQADPITGIVDMSKYDYNSRRSPVHSNFDYGFYDEKNDLWWHANHAHDPEHGHPMRVASDIHEEFNKWNPNYDVTIYIPGISTLPKNSEKQKINQKK